MELSLFFFYCCYCYFFVCRCCVFDWLCFSVCLLPVCFTVLTCLFVRLFVFPSVSIGLCVCVCPGAVAPCPDEFFDGGDLGGGHRALSVGSTEEKDRARPRIRIPLDLVALVRCVSVVVAAHLDGVAVTGDRPRVAERILAVRRVVPLHRTQRITRRGERRRHRRAPRPMHHQGVLATDRRRPRDRVARVPVMAACLAARAAGASGRLHAGAGA